MHERHRAHVSLERPRAGKIFPASHLHRGDVRIRDDPHAHVTVHKFGNAFFNTKADKFRAHRLRDSFRGDVLVFPEFRFRLPAFDLRPDRRVDF